MIYYNASFAHRDDLTVQQIGSSVIENFEICLPGFQSLFLFRLSMDIPYQNSNFHNFAETRFRLISCVRVNEMPECDDK